MNNERLHTYRRFRIAIHASNCNHATIQNWSICEISSLYQITGKAGKAGNAGNTKRDNTLRWSTKRDGF